MTAYSQGEIWTVIVLLAIGTYFIRFSFMGFLGRRRLPVWALRLLRYTPVAVIPGMVAPMVLWPAAAGGETDPLRLAAALVTIAVGIRLRSVAYSISAGAAVLLAGFFLGL